MSDHLYCYPGTNVYRNKENIRDRGELEEFERMATAWRLSNLPHNLPIAPKGYREIHRYMLQDVYDWASQDRWIDTGRTGPFCEAEYIIPELKKRFAAINAENDLRGLDADAFAARAAEHISELNAIHPFLDGNGRTLRAFLEILAERARHPIDLSRIAPQAWNAASIAGFHKQDYGPMCAVIASALASAA